ncbi:hypothetical protein SAMN04488589_0275 [Methanolobus vulcani]|jgi:hypothetical protein|uniref:Uncharacterized protein n=2 Tax=Methanolobus vulcani TaxID=38026 RepID=A0A7Z7AUE9_9EURY|nr:hypothetical protein [Methanolobus sp.]MDK2947756.1 hypothetical protein [Methanolobus sp.]SDF30053.1 hypothetical protein SAMN04488589_0275 [Methanolobus vulcani]
MGDSMKRTFAVLLAIALAITMFAGNAIADENYNDHSADDSQPQPGPVNDDAKGDPAPPCDPNEDIDPAEDRTRNKDA